MAQFVATKLIPADTLLALACNFAKGRWIAESRRPLYSGFKCKQWLSDMWACRLTQRTDFSYEGYRWQPDNCEMPDFNGSEFLRRQQFQSLKCVVTGGEDKLEVENIGWKYGLVKPRGAVRPDGSAYRSSHEPPAFVRKYRDQFDVVVLNTGHHWNRGKINTNRWVMHVNGKPVVDRKLAEIGNAKNFTQEESSDPVIGDAVKSTKVKLLDITAIFELRDEGQISHYSIKASEGINDCLHWCLPGIPDTWNELLYAQL
ncbi:hypothetical protein RND71_029017 [Anisodus tanguticus]|uniref:Trichome birefringence-like N-terminal domain-containing protein n=1 Tax=Anisodus tanguticus TaxID=243964 RepID=A0AAE1V9R5_9SOLA|nr:hypothetical protein RND71_029017 [Anisodus tanguticus]